MLITCMQIAGGDNLKTTLPGKGVVPDYATVQGILIGVVAAFVLFVTIIGPEYVPTPSYHIVIPGYSS